MFCPCRLERHPPTFLKIESMYHFKRYAHAGFRVGHCLYVTLMQVLEFRINTSYYLGFTIHIVLNPSVMAMGASLFSSYLYALPMHVWDNLHRGSNCDMFHLQWCGATSCTVFLKRYAHACLRAHFSETLRPCMFQRRALLIHYAHACLRVCVCASDLGIMQIVESEQFWSNSSRVCRRKFTHIYIWIYVYIYP